MRYVHLTSALGRVRVAGHEERVRPSDQRGGRGIQPRRFPRAAGEAQAGRARKMPFARLDVLRTVAEGLPHRHLETPAVPGRHQAIDTVTPARLKLDAEQAQRLARPQSRRQGIIGVRHGRHAQHSGVGRPGEARLAFQRAGPGVARRIHRAGQQQRQLRVEVAVLIGHVVAQHLGADLRHARGHAHVLLQQALAGVPGRSRHLDRGGIGLDYGSH